MLTYHIFLKRERERIIDVINRVAAEKRFLQTEKYIPTPSWESVLAGERQGAQALIVVKKKNIVVGFVRLFNDEQYERGAGNIGIVLTPEYRRQRAGTQLLEIVLAIAFDYGYKTLTADILADNFISLHLFQSHGFTEHSRRKIYLEYRSAVVEEIKVQLLLTTRHGRNQCSITQQLKKQLTAKTSAD